ncbi:hypothetical protein ACQY0O_000863 [Thecaphora frezii]
MPSKRPRLSDLHLSASYHSASSSRDPIPSARPTASRLRVAPAQPPLRSTNHGDQDQSQHHHHHQRSPPSPGTSHQYRRRSVSKSSQATPERARPAAGPGSGPTMALPSSHYSAPHPGLRPDPRLFTPGPYANGSGTSSGSGSGGPYPEYPNGAADPEARLADDLEAADTAQQNACVIQCKKCLRLLGDTLSFVCVQEELEYVVLSATTSHVRAKEGLCHITMSTPDLGSSYLALECAGCDTELGKQYITTPRELDQLRGAFSISLDKTENYELGSCARRPSESDQAPQSPSAATGYAAPQGGDAALPAAGGGTDAKLMRTRRFVQEIAGRVMQLEDAQRRSNALLKLLMDKTDLQLSQDEEALYGL